MSDPFNLARATVEAIWRIEAPRLIGGLARIVRDLGRAEDLAQDALVAALELSQRAGTTKSRPRHPPAERWSILVLGSCGLNC